MYSGTFSSMHIRAEVKLPNSDLDVNRSGIQGIGISSGIMRCLSNKRTGQDSPATNVFLKLNFSPSHFFSAYI